METNILSRAYLETLSSADLIALADDYGIDIPDDLSRRFIIGELLEVAEELKNEHASDGGMHIANASVAESELPESFNETQIGMVMRNPVWAFVYWDIGEGDKSRFSADADFRALVLRVSFFADEDSAVPEESFDVQIDTAVREQYVLFPAGKSFVGIELVAQYQAKGIDVLARTSRYMLPCGSAILSQAQPGHDVPVSPIAELSSLKELLREHYQNHRQSFLS